MNLNSIDFENIPSKTKWLCALSAYCIIVVNILWAFGSAAPILTMLRWENGVETLHVSNVYHFWVNTVSYVFIICCITNAFNGRPKATTFWVCLAAITINTFHTLFGLCVLAFVVGPYVKRLMSAKFVQAVKSASASQTDAVSETPPVE